jgi:hypothetical protein
VSYHTFTLSTAVTAAAGSHKLTRRANGQLRVDWTNDDGTVSYAVSDDGGATWSWKTWLAWVTVITSKAWVADMMQSRGKALHWKRTPRRKPLHTGGFMQSSLAQQTRAPQGQWAARRRAGG